MLFFIRGLLLLSLFSLSAFAYANSQWKYNTELFFAAGDDTSLTGIRWLQPWWQSGRSMAFSDTRFLRSDQSTEEINIGGGYRHLNTNQTAIFGGYGFYDYRSSATNKKFSQITIGGEILLDKWEFRANIYSPIRKSYLVSREIGRPTFKDAFTGHALTRITTSSQNQLVYEEALKGYDLEFGYLLPNADDFEVRANAAFYQFSAPIVGEAKGIRARIESFPRRNMKVSFSIENDNLFKTRSFLEVSLPLGKKIGLAGKRSMHQRMTQFPYRDIDIRETSRIDSKLRSKPEAGGGIASQPVSLAGDIAHIDSSRSVTDPDGSINKPYKSISQCKNAAAKPINCNGSATTIYLHANASATDANGNTQTYIGNITLNDRQQIVGDGVTFGVFSGIKTGVTPILIGNAANGNNTPVVSMKGNNTVLMGVQLGWDFKENANTLPTIDGVTGFMPNKAVFVDNSSNAVIRDVSITGMERVSTSINESNNFSTGIHIFSNNNSGRDITSIHTVNIKTVLGDGIYGELNLNQPNTQDEQTIIIRDINIQQSGRGIHASVDGVNDSNAVQELRVVPSNPSTRNLANQIQFNSNEGILMENLVALNTLNGSSANPPTRFTAEQKLVVSNTNLFNNQGAGIQTLFGPTSNNAARTSSVELSRTTLSKNDGSGLVLGSLSSNVTAELSNTIFNNNIPQNRQGGTTFGRRIDARPIDCGTQAAENTDTCNAAGINDKRTNLGGFNYRQTGYGIYAMNKDANGAPSTQSINIKENFVNTLHDSSGAQIFLESIHLQEGSSQQKITLRPIADESRQPSDSFDPLIRQLDTSSGQTGSSTPRIAFCDNTSGDAATNTDNISPHIPAYGGDLSAIAKEERCP